MCRGGTPIEIADGTTPAVEDIAAGHKVALHDIPEDAPVHKYGEVIGAALAGELLGHGGPDDRAAGRRHAQGDTWPRRHHRAPPRPRLQNGGEYSG
ncbi:hypothetical protein HEP87_49965 [Streptomyces sp. S1D4-11]|nr:hypothetical protein [Streptomyces sp. S1D4-11]QIY92930.1 hypothetical protein HEP87_49965 [Streptomyces sp. S1D4-11]